MPLKDPEARKAYEKTYKKRYYEVNKEARKAYMKRYYEANRDRILATEAKRFTKFKQSFAARIECLRHTSSAFFEARVQEILTWAGLRHSYWVDSEIQNIIDNQQPRPVGAGEVQGEVERS
jgi:hypothetical protein